MKIQNKSIWEVKFERLMPKIRTSNWTRKLSKYKY